MPKTLLATLFALTVIAGADARTITFSGYEWEVRPTADSGGPGPNHWDEDNVSIDSQGFLHLKLTQRDGEWYCSEVSTLEALGFGLYQFSIVGRVDLFDPNIVLGLFNYPEPDIGPDGTNEIDIEFARWGVASNPIDNFTIFPAKEGLRPTSVSFPLVLRGAGQSVHTFDWSPTSIMFQSFNGRRATGTPQVSWLFQPKNPNNRIPQSLLPVHLNLWLFQGNAPTDGREVEIVVRSFSFTPLLP
ncbi:MAG: glycoside hydrolase family 16 protein [Verrucomicrobiota bacterium]|nr:glycoside hydrolase family 16 protein [Verrucomicrobiota bacterium]